MKKKIGNTFNFNSILFIFISNLFTIFFFTQVMDKLKLDKIYEAEKELNDKGSKTFE